MTNNKELGHAIGWDDEIVNDGQEYLYIDEGDYSFTVEGFERGTFPGSAKIPQCNKATVTLKVHTPQGDASVKYDLILWSSLEWKIAEFFRCIGLKKHGEPLRPKWNAITGCKGRGRFYTREYTKRDGGTGKTNDVRRLYDPEDWTADADKAADLGSF